MRRIPAHARPVLRPGTRSECLRKPLRELLTMIRRPARASHDSGRPLPGAESAPGPVPPDLGAAPRWQRDRSQRLPGRPRYQEARPARTRRRHSGARCQTGDRSAPAPVRWLGRGRSAECRLAGCTSSTRRVENVWLAAPAPSRQPGPGRWLPRPSGLAAPSRLGSPRERTGGRLRLKVRRRDSSRGTRVGRDA